MVSLGGGERQFCEEKESFDDEVVEVTVGGGGGGNSIGAYANAVASTTAVLCNWYQYCAGVVAR